MFQILGAPGLQKKRCAGKQANDKQNGRKVGAKPA